MRAGECLYVTELLQIYNFGQGKSPTLPNLKK